MTGDSMYEVDAGFDHVLLEDAYASHLVSEAIGLLLQDDAVIRRRPARSWEGTLTKSILAVRQNRGEPTPPLGGAEARRERIVGEHALDDFTGDGSLAVITGHTPEERLRLSIPTQAERAHSSSREGRLIAAGDLKRALILFECVTVVAILGKQSSHLHVCGRIVRKVCGDRQKF
jgi:hypothetical protein